MKCPHCRANIDVQLIKAPPDAAPARSSASEDLAELLESIDEDTLEDAAAKFVSETKDRFRKYGKTTRMSDKQLGWLRSIAEGANRKDDWN